MLKTVEALQRYNNTTHKFRPYLKETARAKEEIMGINTQERKKNRIDRREVQINTQIRTREREKQDKVGGRERKRAKEKHEGKENQGSTKGKKKMKPENKQQPPPSLGVSGAPLC